MNLKLNVVLRKKGICYPFSSAPIDENSQEFQLASKFLDFKDKKVKVKSAYLTEVKDVNEEPFVKWFVFKVDPKTGQLLLNDVPVPYNSKLEALFATREEINICIVPESIFGRWGVFNKYVVQNYFAVECLDVFQTEKGAALVLDHHKEIYPEIKCFSQFIPDQIKKENIAKKTTKSKWIKVEDRMPSVDETKILVFGKNRVDFADLTWSGVNIYWKNITHWMPIELPEEI